MIWLKKIWRILEFGFLVDIVFFLVWYCDSWYDGNEDDLNMLIFWWLIWQWSEFVIFRWVILQWSDFFLYFRVNLAMIRICWYFDGWYGNYPKWLIFWCLIWLWFKFADILMVDIAMIRICWYFYGWSSWRWSKLVDILMFDMAAAFCRTPDGIHFTRQEGNQRTGQPSAQNKYNSKCIFQDGIHFIYEERGLPKNWTAPRTKQIQFKINFSR